MWRKLIPVQVEKRFLYRCKISLRNTYQAPNYWKEHHKVEETMKGQATVHSTLLAVHVCVRMHVRVCVCVCEGGKHAVLGGRELLSTKFMYNVTVKNKSAVYALQTTISLSIKKNPKMTIISLQPLNIMLCNECTPVILQWSNTFSALR